jgi:hypothetical protein
MLATPSLDTLHNKQKNPFLQIMRLADPRQVIAELKAHRRTELLFFINTPKPLDSLGSTPLHWAAMQGPKFKSVINYLLELGADPACPNKFGHTAYSIAATYTDLHKDPTFLHLFSKRKCWELYKSQLSVFAGSYQDKAIQEWLDILITTYHLGDESRENWVIMLARTSTILFQALHDINTGYSEKKMMYELFFKIIKGQKNEVNTAYRQFAVEYTGMAQLKQTAIHLMLLAVANWVSSGFAFALTVVRYLYYRTENQTHDLLQQDRVLHQASKLRYMIKKEFFLHMSAAPISLPPLQWKVESSRSVPPPRCTNIIQRKKLAK